MDKKRIFDIVMVSSIVGMVVCLGIEVTDKTNVGYDTMGDRLRFGWWFYMQGGREQTLTELENYVHCMSISNSTNHRDETIEMNDQWRVIARGLYESKMSKRNAL